MISPTVLEICAGAGGQASGLDEAGFELVAAVEIDKDACNTLRKNRPSWNVVEASLADFAGGDYRGVDLLAGGVPCPPFSIAGKQLGDRDERNLFPEALRLIQEASPRAVMLENVPGFASERFSAYREGLLRSLRRLGYEADWRVLNACWFGVPQLRPRFVLVAFKGQFPGNFGWPQPDHIGPPTVGEAIGDLMASCGWPGSGPWRSRASRIAPTLVGGSKKHGGPDLGPTRARHQWSLLGVDGLGVSDSPPGADDPPDLMPRLTVRMAARIQGFRDVWEFAGGKTSSYRQVGNAFPPPVARRVGKAMYAALTSHSAPALRREQIPLFAVSR